MAKLLTTSNNSAELRDLALSEFLSYKNSVKNDNILVLVLHRIEKSIWKIRLGNNFSPNILSFFSFVQKELKNNWDFVVNSSTLVSDSFAPTFLTFESSQILMTKLIEFFKSKSSLTEISLTNEELAQKMLSNLYYLASSNTHYSLYPKLITKQSISKDLLKTSTYLELGKLLETYMSRTLEKGVIDYPSALYLYTNILLKNTNYLNSLKKYKKIIVCDYESQVPVIDHLLKTAENISLFQNNNGAYGIFFPNSNKSTNLLDEFQLKDISKEKNQFLNDFEANLFYDKNLDLNSGFVKILDSFEDESQLVNCIFELIKTSETKKISILSSKRNPILEYSLLNFTKENNIAFLNLDKNERIIDNPFSYSFISLASLYFDYNRISINSDEFKQLLIILFDFNIFLASSIANKTKINKNFVSVLKSNKNLNEMQISNVNFYLDLFSKSFGNCTELFVYIKENHKLISPEALFSLNKLIHVSEAFFNNISNFENIKNSNFEFFMSIRRGLKESESLEEINKKLNFEGVILGTGSSFLNYSKDVDTTIFVDTESDLWNINFVNILQNPFLLNSSFSKNITYDFSTDIQFKKFELFNLISKITNLSKKGIVFLESSNSYASMLKNAVSKLKNQKYNS